jgi:glycosyltransferase involved in cell wall biosynthesis
VNLSVPFPGRDLLVGDTPAELAAAAESLLSDPTASAALGARGRACFVAEHSRWESFDAALLDCVKRAR